MKRYWIEYQDQQPQCPMTNWVHRKSPADPKTWEPPHQPAVPGRGYPVFKTELDGFTFEFASLAEIRACIVVLEKKLLPRTIDMYDEYAGGGLNSSWLSRLPKEVKSWKYRVKAVGFLHKALGDFEQQV